MPKTQRLSDVALVRRSQQGDRQAFGALVTRYDRRLRGLAYALLLDREQMDAALGLAYLRSWRDVLRIQPRDDVGPWLYRAAYNACIDQLRRNEAPGGNRPAPDDVSPGAPGGLQAVLGSLAPADRVAVVLIEREGFSVTSAARILGVTPDELETRLDVARDRLAPHVAAPEPSPKADDVAAEASAPTPTEDQEPAPAGELSGNGAEVHDDVDAAGVEAPGDPSPAPTADEEPAAAETATKTNGHAANRGRGRRARRRANGAERQATRAATATATPAGGEDGAEPANRETESETADPGPGDGSAQPATAPSAGDHQRR
jgi:RNA polymerase sigma-70 factor, ECF subfamily